MGLKAAALKVISLYFKSNLPKLLHSTTLNYKEAFKYNFKNLNYSCVCMCMCAKQVATKKCLDCNCDSHSGYKTMGLFISS